MTGFDRRLKELLEKVRARAEKEGVQWRKADKDVYAFRAGPYVITFAKERDPLVAIYDENGEELEAIDRADLDGRTGPDGKLLLDVKARIWRLARRGAGASAEALDRVLDWLDERVDDNFHPREGAPAVRETQAASDPGHTEFTPQAPQAGHGPQTGNVSQGGLEQAVLEQAGAEQPLAAPAQDEDEEQKDARNGANGHSGVRPPWAQ